MQATPRQNRRRGAYLALWALAFAWPTAASELVVVAGPHCPVNHLSREQVADIYLGRITTLPNGTSALPLDLPTSSEERETFYSRLTGKSAAQIKAYWARMSFTGKGIPPKQLSTSTDIKRYVSNRPGAIAYVDGDAVDASVKVLCSLK